MKTKKEKLKLTALALSASILLTGASSPTQNSKIAKGGLIVNQNSLVELPKNSELNMIRNDLLISRINNIFLTNMKEFTNIDKVKQIIEALKQIAEQNKVEITSITYKYNNNDTHTITIKYINKLTGKEETNTLTSKCTYKNNKCTSCGHTKRYTHTSGSSGNSHTHNYIEISEEIISNNDGKHTITITFECPTDNVRKTTTEIKDCKFTDWVINEEEQTQSRNCLECNYIETKPYIKEEHVHSNPPSDLEYKLTDSNNDGTHNLKGTYTCATCNEEVESIKMVNCTYGEKQIIKDQHLNEPYNGHEVTETCNICGYNNITIENCVPKGDKQYITLGSTLYEYYQCELCEGYVDRKQHNHKYNQTAYENNTTIDHKEVCYECHSGIIEEHHDWTLNEEGNVATCYTCGDNMPVANHTHLPNNIGLMDLIQSDEYKNGQVNSSQTLNPNPSYDKYCSAYEVYCPECGGGYYLSKRDHVFKNGICTRTGCGILDPNYTNTFEEEIIENNQEITYDIDDNSYDVQETSNKLKLVKNS